MILFNPETMITGVGTDIVEISRLKRSVKRYGRKFTGRVFSDREMAYFKDKSGPWPHMAARFAAKEAFAKAMGMGMAGGLRWKEIQILNEKNGRPYVRLLGETLGLFQRTASKKIHVSLSHAKEFATAQVILEK